MSKYLIFFYTLFCLLLATNHVQAMDGYKIDIDGSFEFKEQVSGALILLRKKSPQEYKVIKNHIGKIEENSRSGMLPYAQPPTYQMSLKTALYSITWCAGTIAHDAYHSKLYHDYKKKYGEPIPYDSWAGFESEKKCLEFQIKTLKEINAPMEEINYCLSLDGTYGDINKDGNLDGKDYFLRNW